MKTRFYLIAGSGRNTGKTTLACLIIETLSVKKEVTAVKISKHMHPLTDKLTIILDLPGLLITEEFDKYSEKDSSRYLQAGAKRSFFIQANDEKFHFLAKWMKEHFTEIVVCETGYLGNFLTPDKAFFIGNKTQEKQINWEFPYSELSYDGKEFYPSVSTLLTD